MGIYYVYGLTDPRKDDIVFYVGKGKSDRWKHHFTKQSTMWSNKHKAYIIKSIIAEGKIPGVIFYYQNLSEEEAYSLEVELIKKFGRITYDDEGILTNVCNEPGPPSRKGWKHSQKTKDAIGKANRGGKTANYGEKNGFYGKTHSPELKAFLAQQAKEMFSGKRWSDERRAAAIANYSEERKHKGRLRTIENNKTPRMRELTSTRNVQMGILKTTNTVRNELDFYIDVVDRLSKNESIREIAKITARKYNLIWRISNKIDYYMNIIDGIKNERL